MESPGAVLEAAAKEARLNRLRSNYKLSKISASSTERWPGRPPLSYCNLDSPLTPMSFDEYELQQWGTTPPTYSVTSQNWHSFHACVDDAAEIDADGVWAAPPAGLSAPMGT